MSTSTFNDLSQKIYPFFSDDIANRSFHIDFAGLDNDLIRLESFQGTEGISQPFEFNLELRANDLPNIKPFNLSFSNVIGNSATIVITQPNASPVIFNGIVTSFGKSDPGVYSATLRPSLWKLTMSNNYCLYDDKIRTIPEMILLILANHQINVDNQIHGQLPNLREQDWFQAGETDFEFITHLMQKVGIYYYFVHYVEEDGTYNHKMILGDDSTAYQPITPTVAQPKGQPAHQDSRIVQCTFTKEESVDYDDVITSFSYEENLSPSWVQTFMMAPQSAWEISSGAPVTTAKASRQEITESRPNTQNLEFTQLLSMQYGINNDEAQLYRDKALSNIMSTSCKYLGTSTVAWFSPGQKFTTSNNIDPQLNQEYVVTEISHAGSVDNNYSNQFQASLPDYLAVQFSMNDTFPNTVLATVVAGSGSITMVTPQNEECIAEVDYIKIDEYDPDQKTLTGPSSISAVRKGIYVHFPWNEAGVAHWVQLSESMQYVPEVNSTVLVSRSNDNNELPEVVNSVRADGSYTVTPENETFNTTIGNSNSYHIGESQSASDGPDYSKNCGSSSRVSKGDSINLSIAESSSVTFEDGWTTPGKEDVFYPITISTVQNNLGTMPECSKDYDTTNLSYENSYSFSKGNSTNNQYGVSKNYQDGDSINTQDGDSSNTHTGNSINLSIGHSSSATVTFNDGMTKPAKGFYPLAVTTDATNKGNMPTWPTYDSVNLSYEDSYNYSKGNSTNNQYGVSKNYQDGDSINTQDGDSSNTHLGDSINLSIGQGTHKCVTFDEGMTDPADAHYPLEVTTDNTNKGNMPTWETYESVNLSYEDTYSYSKGDSTNNQYGDSKNYQDGKSTNTQDGDSDNTQNGNSKNYQKGDLAINTNIVALMTNTSIAAAIINTNIGVTMNISVGPQINISVLDVNVVPLEAEQKDLEARITSLEATVNAGIESTI